MSTITGELMMESSTQDLIAAEIDTQIATAKQFPRSIQEFKATCRELACMDEDTAASMFYVLKRGGKNIEGPSVRMAEVVAYSWKNVRTDKRIVSIDSSFVTAQATCIDLERNVAGRGECKRRITNKEGRRYNDDMIQTTANAAMAIALREAVFSVVPRSLFKDIYEAAKKASIGKGGSFEKSRQTMLQWFTKAGSTEAQVLEFLGVTSIDEVTQEDLVLMKGVATRIKDEGVPVDEALCTKDHTNQDSRHVEKAKQKRAKLTLAECQTLEDVEQVRSEMLQRAKTNEDFDAVHDVCDARMSELKQQGEASAV